MLTVTNCDVKKHPPFSRACRHRYKSILSLYLFIESFDLKKYFNISSFKRVCKKNKPKLCQTAAPLSVSPAVFDQ